MVAIHLRQSDVRQDDVGTLGPHLRDGGLAVGDRDHTNPLVGERQLNHPLNGDAVVGKQEGGHHAFRRLPPAGARPG